MHSAIEPIIEAMKFTTCSTLLGDGSEKANELEADLISIACYGKDGAE